MSNITVNYFDLGLHDGLEISKFLEDTDGLPGIEVHVHGIEADPSFADCCRERFAADSRVQIHNFAVGSEDGHVYLYIHKMGGNIGLGSSIYADKPNVTSDRVRVPQYRLSTWLRKMGFLPKPVQTVNIIKANIEGAEWDLIQDLDREGLFDHFDLFCGAAHDQSWITDMKKIPSLRPRADAAKAILEKHGIHVCKYHVSTKGKLMDLIDMRKAVTGLLHKACIMTAQQASERRFR